MIRLAKLSMLGCIVAFGGVLALGVAPWLDLEQEFGLGWMYLVRGPVAPPSEVVIVAIEEESARQLGVAGKAMDWPRTQHAELVRFLQRSGARVIVFDMTFDRPSARPDDDALFAAAVREAANVFITTSVVHDVVELPAAGTGAAGSMVIDRQVPPIPALESAALGYAPFLLPKTSRVDAYWTSRSGTSELPTLPVLALRFLATAPALPDGAPTSPLFDRGRLQATLASLRADGEIGYLNFYGPPQTLANAAYHEVLALARGQRPPFASPGLDAEFFRGKAVFVGLSARTPTGQDRLRDDYRTHYSQPDGLNLTGVEIAATAFANLLQGRPLRPLQPAGQLTLVLAWAALLAVICDRLRPAPAVALVATLSMLYLALVCERFIDAARWLPSVIPIGVQGPLALVAGITLHYRVVKRERTAIKRAFGHFLPSTMVDQLALDTGSMTRSNRVVFGSCLATDAGNYTTLAERMEPGPLAELMNDYFAHLFVPVERSGGAVVDVVGDAMVAIWAGAKDPGELRRSACIAALDIAAAVDRFHRGLPSGMVLPTRMGLHSGEMLVGNIGASGHFEYRAVGDTVNTASRLEGLNKVLGTQLLASAAAVEGLTALLTRPLGSFLLAGKASELAVVQLLGHRDRAEPVLLQRCEQFARALALYGQRQWQAAAETLSSVIDQTPDDGPSLFYLRRCRELLAADPGPDWSPTIVVLGK